MVRNRRDLSEIHSVVMDMLAAGEARAGELSLVSGVSKQVISLWIATANLDWEARRTRAVGTLFAKRMLNRQKERSKLRRPKG